MEMDLMYDYSSALKKCGLTQSQVDKLRELAKDYDIIPKSLTNKQLLLFLQCNDCDYESAVKMLCRHYEIRKLAPQLFTNRDADSPAMKQCNENQYFALFPTTPEDHQIVFYGLQNSSAKNFHYNPSTAGFLMMIAHSLSKFGPSKGLIVVYDMRNFNAGHLLRNNLKSMKRFFAFIQEGMPIKIQEVHIFNTWPSFHIVKALIKPVMRADLMDRMHLHSSNVDMEKIYNQHLPRSCLPSDYGGSCKSIDELHKQLFSEFLELREFYMMEEKQANLELD